MEPKPALGRCFTARPHRLVPARESGEGQRHAQFAARHADLVVHRLALLSTITDSMGARGSLHVSSVMLSDSPRSIEIASSQHRSMDASGHRYRRIAVRSRGLCERARAAVSKDAMEETASDSCASTERDDRPTAATDTAMLSTTRTASEPISVNAVAEASACLSQAIIDYPGGFEMRCPGFAGATRLAIGSVATISNAEPSAAGEIYR